MARLIANWLNDEVVLSKPVTSIAEDFKNGYLLGELLHKFNQQHRFDEFIDNDTPDAKINNFCLLEPTMRQIGVFFNSKTAYEVMNAVPGATKTLLYEIRTVLHSAIRMGNSNNKGQGKVFQIIKTSKPLYDQTMSITFENAVRGMVDNPNDVLMQKSLKHFSDMENTFRENLNIGYSQSLNDMQQELEINKHISRQRKEHEHEFNETWNALAKEQWKKNQTIAKERRTRETAVNQLIATRKKEKKLLENDNARIKAITGIDDFEEHLRKMQLSDTSKPTAGTTTINNNLLDANSIKTAGGSDGTGIPSIKSLNTTYLNHDMVHTQHAMKEKNDHIHKKRMEHDRRRKKFVTEKSLLNANYIQNDAECDIMKKLLNPCKLENVEKIAKLKIMEYKNIYYDNYMNRKQLIAIEKDNNNTITSEWNKEEITREMNWYINTKNNGQILRHDTYMNSINSSTNKEITEYIENEIYRIIDVVDWIVSIRNINLYNTIQIDETYSIESIIIPQVVYNDIKNIYISDNMIPKPLQLPIVNNYQLYYPHQLSWNPPVHDLRQLVHHLFHGVDYMSDPKDEQNNNEISESSDQMTQSQSTICNSINTESLALSDSVNFIKAFTNFSNSNQYTIMDGSDKSAVVDTKKGKDEKKGGKNAAEEVKTESPFEIVTPQWIDKLNYDVTLGELVLSTKTIINPIPPLPDKPEDVPVYPIRLILTGISDRLRKIIAEKVSQQYNLHIISINSVINEMMKLGEVLYHKCSKITKSEIDEFKSKCTLKENLSGKLYRNAIKGSELNDDIYTSIIINEIKLIKEVYNDTKNGYVICDYPNNLSQMKKLIYILSNIDYDKSYMQLLDNKSDMTACEHREKEEISGKLCGIDYIYYIDSDPKCVVEKRLNIRDNYNTNSVITINSNMNNMKGLGEIITPSNPSDTLSLKLITLSKTCQGIFDYYSPYDIIKKLYMIENVNSDDLSHIDDIISSTIYVDCEKLLAVSSNNNDISNDNSNGNGNNDELINNVISDTEKMTIQNDNTDQPIESGQETPIIEKIKIDGVLNNRLANVLNNIWTNAENQLRKQCSNIFTIFRDIRYQIQQRKCLVNHVITSLLMKITNKQQILNTFCNDFNSFENDFRYDNDLKSELHLRTLEMKNIMYDITDNKMKLIKMELNKIQIDNIANLLIHQCRCEASLLLQTYGSLYIASQHIIFDYFKAISSYDYYRTYDQVLEDINAVPEGLTEITSSANNQSSKDKKGAKTAPPKGKGKDAAANGSREAVFVPILSEAMEELPEAGVLEVEEEVDPKGKKKPAASSKTAKKGKEEVNEVSVFVTAANNAKAFCQAYMKGNFVVNREKYSNNEKLCSQIECAIWHETDRFLHVIDLVTSLVNGQEKWMMNQETHLIDIMNKLIETRYDIELSIIERITLLIHKHINNHIPIRERWEISNDLIIINKEKLIYPKENDEVIPTVQSFDTCYLNNEQINVMNDLLQQLSLNEVIYEEDLYNIINQCKTNIGPLSEILINNMNTSSIIKNVTFPKYWRNETTSDIMKCIYKKKKITGSYENIGNMPIEEVLENIEKYGNYIDYEKRKEMWTSNSNV